MTRAGLTPLGENVSRSDQVCAALLGSLLSGDFAPGERMHEARIAAELGVSKTPVREALSMLRAKGLVESSPTRGIVAIPIDRELVRTLHEVRELLEPIAVQRAVPNRDRELIAKAAKILADSERAGKERDLRAMSTANRSFHELTYERCGNSLIRRILNDMRDQLQYVASNSWKATQSWEGELEEHSAILDAVSVGDAELAAQLTTNHIKSAATRFIAIFANDKPDIPGGLSD